MHPLTSVLRQQNPQILEQELQFLPPPVRDLLYISNNLSHPAFPSHGPDHHPRGAPDPAHHLNIRFNFFITNTHSDHTDHSIPSHLGRDSSLLNPRGLQAPGKRNNGRGTARNSRHEPHTGRVIRALGVAGHGDGQGDGHGSRSGNGSGSRNNRLCRSCVLRDGLRKSVGTVRQGWRWFIPAALAPHSRAPH